MVFKSIKQGTSGFLLALFCTCQLIAQPGTEVYVFDFNEENGNLSISNPINVSNNPGYDNQPYFFPDGMTLLYAATKEDQTEIVKYDLTRQTRTFLTESDGSEYSPTLTPDKKFISAILLERDGRQLLWKYPVNGGDPSIVVPELKIGYHCWVDKNTVVSFVLGEPATLQVSNVKSGKSRVVAQDIGRSLHKIPKSNLVSYVQKKPNNPWTINSLNPKTGKSEMLVNTLKDIEDYAWTPDGALVMGKGSKLFKFDLNRDSRWVEVADLSKDNLGAISRLAVSRKGNRIAIVVNE